MATDARSLRALAHPIRWKLMDLLQNETSATVTRCAEVLGESTASCSYHLGMLAKYGYIEKVPDQPGREKPWRLTEREVPWSLAPPGLDLEGQLASEAALEVYVDHQMSLIKDRLRRRELEPRQWQQAQQIAAMTTWLTAEQLSSVGDEFAAILLRLGDDQPSPENRPADARMVHLFYATSVAQQLPPKRAS